MYKIKYTHIYIYIYTSVKIRCVNEVDSSPELPLSIYMLRSVEGPGVYTNWLLNRSKKLNGDNNNECNDCFLDLPKAFPCSSGDRAKECKHELKSRINGAIVECSYGCTSCTKGWYSKGRKEIVNCGLRDMQAGLKFKVEIFKTKKKGWGVRYIYYCHKYITAIFIFMEVIYIYIYI